MKPWKSHSITVSCLFLLLFAAVACSEPQAAIEKPTVSQRPAEFEVGPIAFEPPVAMVGDSVTVSATVKNIGDVIGTYSAILTIDSQVLDKKELTLIPQQNSIIEFTASGLTAGKHSINIGESNVVIDILPKPAKIALARYYGDYYSWEICTVDPDGTNIKNVTNSASLDLCPTWSPDGMKIAFQSIRESHTRSSIYVMDADGKNVKCLTPEPAICRFPVWSPDGSKIAYCVMKIFGGSAFTKGGEEIRPDKIYTMNSDGSGKMLVTDGWGPSWFPDSQRIAFMSSNTGVWEIHSINIYSADLRKHITLPKARVNYGLPLPSCEFPVLAVSPDGGSIALEYFDYTTGAKQDISVLTLNNGEVRDLTSKYDGYKYCPTWSPDGTKIAFTLETINGIGIYTMDTNGSNMTKLIENGYFPTWQR